MVILSNGYKLPETGDFGSIWFPALEDNITRTNDHVHDGSDSNLIPATSVEGVPQTVLAAAFSGSAPNFTATVTIPSVDMNYKHVIFRDTTTKEPLYLKYTKLSATQIIVTINIVQDIEVLLI